MTVVNEEIDKYQKCIDQCNRCAQASVECMTMCLNEPDAGKRKNCILSLNECASVCTEASYFMSMDSKYAVEVCRLCETICSQCAQDCEMFSDDHCKQCAAECRSCAQKCSMMAGA